MAPYKQGDRVWLGALLGTVVSVRRWGSGWQVRVKLDGSGEMVVGASRLRPYP